MMSISHNRILGPQDAQLRVSIPNFEDNSAHETDEALLPRRAFGSASTSDSYDPFSEVLPWTALFESKIWSPSKDSFPTDVSSPIDIADESITDVLMTDHIRRSTVQGPVIQLQDPRPPWLTSILDPTALAFGFDHSCLRGLDKTLLHTPREAFAVLCWETATITSPSESAHPQTNASSPPSGINIASQGLNSNSRSQTRSSQQLAAKRAANAAATRTSPADADYSPSSGSSSSFSIESTILEESPIPVFLAPSSWSDATAASDTDESYEDNEGDEVYSYSTVTGVHSVGPFITAALHTPRKQKDLRQFDDTKHNHRQNSRPPSVKPKKSRPAIFIDPEPYISPPYRTPTFSIHSPQYRLNRGSKSLEFDRLENAYNSNLNHDKATSIGHFPSPVIRPSAKPNKTKNSGVGGKIAAFLGSNIPGRRGLGTGQGHERSSSVTR